MILGIDTSCYTTSVAACDDNGRLLCSQRRLLPVPVGSCGLRQSDALFAHVRQLPQLLEQVFASVEQQTLRAVAVSARPRPRDDSYMPVFLAGALAAHSIATAQQTPCFELSHQEGHVAAALASVELDWRQPFLALHLSGGTGEILKAVPHCGGYDIEVVGDTDLPPGQFIDRVGVALGLDFPAGPQLEALAETAASTELRLSGAVRGTHISFSGPETAAQRAIAGGADPAQVAAAVLDNIAKSLSKAIVNARDVYGPLPVLLSGGVAANQRLRRKLESLHVSFGRPEFSGDNAFGVAVLGAQLWRAQNGGA